ncbi:MAG: hypothetical protein ACKOGG_00610, partial [Actinomycetota bacterium]
MVGAHVKHRHPFTPFDEAPPRDADSFAAMPIPESILPQVVGENFRHRLGTFALDVVEWLPEDPETVLTIDLKRRLLHGR